jgi:hypothetical protein
MNLLIVLFLVYICNAYSIANDLNQNNTTLDKRDWCSLAFTCTHNPYYDDEFGHYIGYTDGDCRNIKICSKNSKFNFCYNQNRKNRNCSRVGPFYKDCYDKNGKAVSVYPLTTGYENPFSNKSVCISRWSVVLNPGNDKNCYYGAYGNKVLVKNNKSRNGVTTNIINNRCLAGNGWCPCSRR